MQTVVYNVGIAAGSFAGGLALDHGGARTLPWVALPLVIAALGTVIGARRTAFPPFRPGRLRHVLTVTNRRHPAACRSHHADQHYLDAHVLTAPHIDACARGEPDAVPFGMPSTIGRGCRLSEAEDRGLTS
jgi:hypothetical protein